MTDVWHALEEWLVWFHGPHPPNDEDTLRFHVLPQIAFDEGALLSPYGRGHLSGFVAGYLAAQRTARAGRKKKNK